MKSPRTLIRDTLAEFLWSHGLTMAEAGKLLGVSATCISQAIRKRQMLRRRSKHALLKFKIEHCPAEIRRIKREYDNMPSTEQSAQKQKMAAEIDMLLAHYRTSFAEGEWRGVT
jgi:predicted transcriptional regulator